MRHIGGGGAFVPHVRSRLLTHLPPPPRHSPRLLQQTSRLPAGGVAWDEAAPALLDLLLGPEQDAAPQPPPEPRISPLSGVLIVPPPRAPAEGIESARLRAMAQAEAARCVEALLLAPLLDATNVAAQPLAAFLATLPGPAVAASAASLRTLGSAERKELGALRDTLFRVASLLAASSSSSSSAGAAAPGGAPAASPFTADEVRRILRQPRAASFVAAVASRVGQRAFARAVKMLADAAAPQPPPGATPAAVAATGR